MKRSALALLLLALPLWADHEVLTLECPAQLQYLVVRDLDRDGLDDLIVLAEKQSWWWRGRRAGWSAAPAARLDLPRGAAIFDVGSKDGGRDRLIVRTSEAYWALEPGSEPERLPRRSGPGLPAESDSLLWRGFFRDFDRDGLTDFLDVSLDGYAISYGSGAEITLPALLTETASTAAGEVSERFVARYALGDWTDGDFDGDGQADFAVMTPEGLRVHPGDSAGRFAPDRRFLLRLEEAEDADLSFHEFNQDGRTDVLAMRRKDGQAVLLIADPEKGLRRPHRMKLNMPGYLRHPRLADFDGDGTIDLALPYNTKPSVQDAVRVVMRGEFLLKVPIFLNRGGAQPFARLADRQLTLPLRIRVGTDATGRIKLSGLVVVEYGGDLDADGRSDLLVTVRPDLLAFHRGVEGRLFEDEQKERIPVPDCSAYDSIASWSADLNGDGVSDVLLHYRGAGRRPDKLHLLLSR